MRNQAVDTMHVDISWQVFCDGEHKKWGRCWRQMRKGKDCGTDFLLIGLKSRNGEIDNAGETEIKEVWLGPMTKMKTVAYEKVGMFPPF